MKALARLAGPVPRHDHPIELHNLLLEAEELSTERGKARTGNLRHPFVARVGNNMQQFRDTFTPDRRDNAELGEVRLKAMPNSDFKENGLCRPLAHRVI